MGSLVLGDGFLELFGITDPELFWDDGFRNYMGMKGSLFGGDGFLELFRDNEG